MLKEHFPPSIMQLLCIVNGVPVGLTWQKAHELMWALPIGWIACTGFYRYKFGRHRRAFYLHEEIEAAEIEFLFRLHMARCRPITERDIPFGPDDDTGISRQALLARRARAGKVYPATYDPIEIVPLIIGATATHGYLFKRGIRWIVILDTAPPGRLADWALLTGHPGKGPDQIDPLLGDARRANVPLLMAPHGTK